MTFDERTLKLDLAGVTPCSPTPTPVYFEHEGNFHSFVGCPAEALTVTAMPMLYALGTHPALAMRVLLRADDPRGPEHKSHLMSPCEPIVSFVGSPYGADVTAWH